LFGTLVDTEQFGKISCCCCRQYSRELLNCSSLFFGSFR